MLDQDLLPQDAGRVTVNKIGHYDLINEDHPTPRKLSPIDTINKNHETLKCEPPLTMPRSPIVASHSTELFAQNVPSMASLQSRTRDVLSEVSASISATSLQDKPNVESATEARMGGSDMYAEEVHHEGPKSPRSIKAFRAGTLGQHQSIGFAVGNKKTEDDEKNQRPAWSELKTKAGKERKRLPLACIACRRKKIRCSGEKPACKHCLRSRIPCVYKVTTRKPAPRTDYMTMLDKRLKRMEERVIKIMPEQDAGKLAAIGRASVKPSISQNPKVAGAKKRAAEEAFGTDLNEWANDAPTGGLARQFPGVDPAENRLLSEGSDHLPPREIQEHLAEVFFDYLYGQSYHVLHKPSFMRKLK